MAKLVWDQIGEHLYETGVSNGVLYTFDKDQNKYTPGVAWNGLASISENPSGAEETKIFADNNKYLSLFSAEEFGATIEAYTYPDEFAKLDGSAELAPGVLIGQQNRATFGLCYKTLIGNDVDGNDHGYKLHLVYGCKASPSQKSFTSVNDSPEAATMSWEITTTPVGVDGYKNTATLTLDSTKITAENMKKIEDVLYGTTDKAPELPLPSEIVALIGQAAG